MLSLTRYEQETTLNYNQEEKFGNIYTCDKSLIRKLNEYAKIFPNDVKIKSGDSRSMEYQINKRLITVRKPKQVSDKQREELSNRMKYLRTKKQ